MTTTFESITQYDKSFDEICKLHKYRKGFVCSIFSVMTAYDFMLNSQKYNDNIVFKECHKNNIEDGYNIGIVMDISFGLKFDELISSYTSLNFADIEVTSVELIKENIIGFDRLIPEKNDNPKVVIFLKNQVFMTLLINKHGYYLRNCHEKEQYNFINSHDVAEHLIEKYQFTSKIDILGDAFAEYSSIEFIIINKPFDIFFYSD